MTEPLLVQPSIRDDRGLAMDAAMARLGRLDLSTLLVYAIRHVTPTALPHLVDQFHMTGLEGWDTVSTDPERRALVLGSIAYHRLKGTLAGLRLGGGRVGLSIVRAITPPAKVYMAPTLTRAERDAFLARYPQLRLYRYRIRSVRLAQGWYSGSAFVGAANYPTVTDAQLRMGWRSFLWQVGGAEAPITTLVREIARERADAELFVNIRRPGSAGFGFYPGRLIPHAYYVTQDASGRLYNVTLSSPYTDFDELLHQRTAPPGLDPINIRYTQVAQRWIRHGAMLGAWLSGHLVDNGARDRLYRRFWLFDPAVPVPRRGRSTHVGAMKLGMPAYTAELRTSQPGQRSPRIVGAFGCGYWAPASTSRLERGAAALRLAVAVRDKVWIDTHDRQTLTCGGAVFSGRHRAGDIISRSI